MAQPSPPSSGGSSSRTLRKRRAIDYADNVDIGDNLSEYQDGAKTPSPSRSPSGEVIPTRENVSPTLVHGKTAEYWGSQIRAPPRPGEYRHSNNPNHPHNMIPDLCRQFYKLGWVTGTGGGVSMKWGNEVFIAPSGVQKELIEAEQLFVMDFNTREYTRRPYDMKPSACTPLFMAAYKHRGAQCCIHTHSQWAVLVTLIAETGLQGRDKNSFAIQEIEQIKGISKRGGRPDVTDEILEGGRKVGNYGFFDRMRIPIIENTAEEEDLTESLEAALNRWPDTCAVLVRRHGLYVWGKNHIQAKTHAESLDYLFQLAVEMHKLGLPWVPAR